MLFFITPTFQFILGLFLYNEPFDTYRLIGFILIWVAVLIYLLTLYEKKLNYYLYYIFSVATIINLYSETFDQWKINFTKYAAKQGVSDETLSQS